MASGNIKTLITENLTEECKLTWLVGNFAQVISSKETVNAQTISFEMGDSIGLPVKLRWYLQWNEYKKDDGKVLEQIGIYLELDKPPPEGVTEVIASIGVKIKNAFGGNLIKLGSWSESADGRAHNLVNSDWGWSTLMPGGIDTRGFAMTADGSLPIELLVRLMNLNKTNSRDASSVVKFPDLATIVV